MDGVKNTINDFQEMLDEIDQKIERLHVEAVNLVDAYWTEWLEHKEGQTFGRITPRARLNKKKTSSSVTLEIIWERTRRHLSGNGLYREYIKKPTSKNSHAYNISKLINIGADWEAPLINDYEPKFAGIRLAFSNLQGVRKKILSSKKSLENYLEKT